jgi:hypothetical protein
LAALEDRVTTNLTGLTDYLISDDHISDLFSGDAVQELTVSYAFQTRTNALTGCGSVAGGAATLQ